jgi:hypothetical protein
MIPFLLVMALAADVPFATVVRGSASGLETARQVTVRTAAEWRELWKTHAPTQQVPAIDFSTKMVVGVFLGTRPTAGIEVEIVAVRTENDALVVEYVERRPDKGMMTAQILTEPFHLVSLPKHDGPVRFVQRTGPGR